MENHCLDQLYDTGAIVPVPEAEAIVNRIPIVESMPILPLDHPEPFAATLGVMLYPGEDEAERRKAGAFASFALAGPIAKFVEDGGEISRDTLLKIVTNAGERLTDLEKRWRDGRWAGDLYRGLFYLSWEYPKLASSENVIRLAEIEATRAGSPGSRSNFKAAQSQFKTVSHLWAAWMMRGGKFVHDPDTGYTGWIDFQSFLAESEVLRDWGQYWKPDYANAKTPLPDEVWRVPEDWQPPDQREGWPTIGLIRGAEFHENDLKELKPVTGSKLFKPSIFLDILT
jgi:hypothetical protein